MLELVIAIGLFAMLAGMIFATASTNLALGNTVVERQNEESVRNAFFELMTRRFGSLPGNTRMELVSRDVGNRYLSDLTLQNVPLAFTWGGSEQVAKAVQLSTVERRDGYLDIVLRYYEEEILQDSDNLNTRRVEPFAEVILLEDVAIFEWRVLDGRTMEWQYDWDLQGRLPLQLELKIAFGQEEIIRQIFWITPKQDPEVMLRQVLQGTGGLPQGPRPNDPNRPGDGGAPEEVPVNANPIPSR